MARSASSCHSALLLGLLILLGACGKTPDSAGTQSSPEQVTIQAFDFSGEWTTTLPAADSAGRILYLSLSEGGDLRLLVDYQNDQDPVEELGSWKQDSERSCSLQLGETPCNYMILEAHGDSLVVVDRNPVNWGSSPFSFVRQK